MSAIKRILSALGLFFVILATFISGFFFALSLSMIYGYVECEADFNGFQCAIVREV